MSAPHSPLDVDRVRKDFPILERRLAGDKPLVYLDSANTSQKPAAVLETLAEHYSRHNANVARAVHQLGEESTAAYEGARDKLAALIKAPSRDEIIFTKNASEALNLVAHTLASGLADDPRYRLGPGDEIVVTEMEHHSNIVPWQLAAKRTGAAFRWFGLTDEGRLDLSTIGELINERTKIVSLVHQSNSLGTVNDVATVVARAREVGALVLLDGSQSVPHQPIDVNELGVDLLAFTGHKMVGPTGIGVLWGRREVLDGLPPFLGGGEMIETVEMTGSTFAGIPHKFEAGTPPIAQAIGLGAAVDYLTGVGLDRIHDHEQAITAYALEKVRGVDGVRIIGPDSMESRGGTVSFVVDGIHPHDVGQLLDEQGVAVRVGHHCARPVCVRYGIPATTRASFYLYTTFDEIDALADGLHQVKRFFG
ncbi:cysteine desulfurase [Jiangella mangrovi]|uniref:Cysteine desulfurase n=1 Tax=Jiangella mangrovi TaxID=1524084 RepID=A0A7W9LMT1_9ACTN|nr:cysteine desulfurase/selenocysteine lyase [Jiangella mangrovi]